MIKRVLLLLVASLWVSAAWADAPVSMVKLLYSDGFHYFADIPTACAADAAYSQSVNTQGYTFSCASTTSTGWSVKKLCTAAAQQSAKCALNSYTFIASTAQYGSWCPATNTAPDTTKPLASQCPPACPAGVTTTVRMNYGKLTRPFAPSDIPSSYAGCAVKAVEFVRCQTTVSTGNLSCTFVVKNTGQVAASGSDSGAVVDTGAPAPGEATATNLPPVKAPDALGCPAGSVQAGMSSDGIPMCVGTGTHPVTSTSSSTTSAPATTTTQDDGSTVTVQDVSSTNADGSVTVTTTRTTVGTDGSKTVAVTAQTGNTPSGAAGKPGAAGSAGAAGAAGADGKDAQGLCQTNPELTICRNSTATADCTAGVSYTGDAIQGATLQAVKAVQCKLQKDDDDLKASSLTTLGQSVVNGNDPMAGKLPSPTNGDVVQMGSIDNSGWLGSGSYFKDKTIDLGDGNSLVLPLSKGEDLMIALRYVTMIVSSLVCFSIIRGTFASSGV